MAQRPTLKPCAPRNILAASPLAALTASFPAPFGLAPDLMTATCCTRFLKCSSQPSNKSLKSPMANLPTKEGHRRFNDLSIDRFVFEKREMEGTAKGGHADRFTQSTSKSHDVRAANIIAAKGVADAVRTSLGPKGMDKMIQVRGCSATSVF